ncbi:MAG: CoxG family protein [Burkholderiaceae bacterium]
MQLTGERVIPAPIEKTWAALNDPEILKASIKGCESLEKTGDDEFMAALKIKIGPVNARFKGKLNLENVQPPNSYTIRFEGQGGVAGFGKGSADVSLESQGDTTLLKYESNAQVGGKIAQIGSRLVDSAASKIAQEFFAEFEQQIGSSDTAA